jgi:hypothetical protein
MSYTALQMGKGDLLQFPFKEVFSSWGKKFKVLRRMFHEMTYLL